VTNIVLDHERAVEMALEHLYWLGHRRIAFMRGPKAIPDSEYRWEGIQKAAKKLGLKLDASLVTRIDQGSWNMKTGHHPMSPEIGYQPMKTLLEKTKAFTAIFCFNDIAAIGAIRALTEAGLKVPQDVSVVGFDDIQSAAYCAPSLTTVRQPLHEMGKTGARILLERIANPTAEYPDQVMMQPEFVVRESTGRVRE
jgi:LacI family transcriptional regulator